MPGLKDIKRRLQTVKNIRKITYAMKLVSAAKLKKAQEAVVSTREYTTALSSLLTELQSEMESTKLSHPLMEAREEIKKVRVLVIGGSRGLCGGYNSNINKKLESSIREIAEKNPSAELSFTILGKKVAEYFKRINRHAAKSFDNLPDDANLWPIDDICRDLEHDFMHEEIDELYVVYTRFKSALSMTPICDRMLPLGEISTEVETAESEDVIEHVEAGDIIFEPSPAEVFHSMVPKIFRARVRQSCLDAKASEQGSRMTAMDAATKNGEELTLKLQLLHNKLRQGSITAELLDIIGGANAVE